MSEANETTTGAAPATTPAATEATTTAAPAVEAKTEAKTEAAPVDNTVPKDYTWVLPKFGKAEGDKFDAELYAQNITKSYAELEKRVSKKGALPPATHAEYDYTPKYEISDTFKEKALKEGKLSKEQYQWVAQQYEALIDEATGTPEKAEAVLKEMWKDEYDKNVRLAGRAMNAFIPSNMDITEVGNDPRLIRILAHIGSQMEEDTTPNAPAVNAGGGLSKEQIGEIMRSPDYYKSQAKQAQVAEWYKKNAPK